MCSSPTRPARTRTTSPGGWAMLQEASRQSGVGLYMENRLQRWQGWGKAAVFSNFRALTVFGRAL